jgi:hypothetical protein
MKVTTTRYRFDQADQALRDLAHDRLKGVAVLDVSGGRQPGGTGQREAEVT